MAEHAYVLGREAPGDDFVQLRAVQTAVMQDAEQLGEAGAEVALRLRERGRRPYSVGLGLVHATQKEFF